MSIGLVHKVRFVQSNSKKFSSYINYISRDEASRSTNFKEFSLYNDYMGNPEKSGVLFTESKDSLDCSESIELKKIYSKAQINGSIMWQDVFSFDNDWLERNGLYDKKTHTVDEAKVRVAVRAAMNELKKDEKIDGIVWSASLHYNTDNIHVHIASVEPNPTRVRGKRKPKTLINMKSKFLNNLVDRQPEYQRINDIIRKNIIDNDREKTFEKDKEIKKMIKDILNELPEDRKQWNYNNNSMKNARPKIDNLTKYYIENYKKEEYKELLNELTKGEEFLKDTYGVGEKFRYKDYKKNKINDLYTRMGNNILSELRVKDKEEKNKEKIRNNNNNRLIVNTFNINKKDINRIKNAVSNDVESAKNQNVYRKLEKEIEYERK